MRAVALLLVADLAHAAPCDDAIVDPIATPLRGTDEQRGACLREQLSAGFTTSVLVDTPNFHGVIDAGLALAGRLTFDRLELGARVRLVDYTYVQTAVNKVTDTRFGPVAAAAALAIDPNLTAFTVVELPYTRDEMATMHTSGQLGLAFTTGLAAPWTLHARLGGVFAYAASSGGDTARFALRTGSEVVWHPHRRFALQLGADADAGWRDGFGALLARAGIAIRIAANRLVVGAGLPLGGDEPITAVIALGLQRDI